MADAPLHVQDLRPEVIAFALEMERKLRENDDKPGWKDCPPLELLGSLRVEVDELEEAVSSFARMEHEDWPHYGRGGGRPNWNAVTLSEAADVANFAMMVADAAGALPLPPAAPSREWLDGKASVDDERVRLGLEPLGSDRGGDTKRVQSAFDWPSPVLQLARDALDMDKNYEIRRQSLVVLLLICGGDTERWFMELGRAQVEQLELELGKLEGEASETLVRLQEARSELTRLMAEVD